MKVKKPDDLIKIKKEGMKLLSPVRTRITVGAATCGLSKDAGAVFETLKREVKKQKVKADVVLVGCNGLCYAEPIVEVIRAGKPRITYGKVRGEHSSGLVKSIKKGDILQELVLMRHDEEKLVPGSTTIKYAKGKLSKAYAGIKEYRNLSFYKKQMKLVSRNAGTISPGSIDEYIAMDGYQALAKAVTAMHPEEVIKEVTHSKLRGRGGGGFPTGLKWKTCREAEGKEKYVICNCSEGDPGIGMHKSLIESDPHSILEGMIIGGYAIGAHKGYIYLHYGNGLAKERLQKAIDQANNYGLLGKNIFNSGFSFTITLKEGAGGYVCGESTALMASVEGNPGEPRPKYTHTAEKGLWDSPTNLNNVETWCNVPLIILKGADWYAKIGTKGSKGTKLISLSGTIKKSCLVEVPMGITLKEIISDFGGGIPEGNKLKAVQIGGPPAGILPAKLANLPIDFDRLYKAGSMLGSGGMVVMDDQTSMLDMAKYFADFCAEETCGKCSSCREGSKRMQEVLGSIMEGQGTRGHISLIKRLAAVMEETSLCDFGKTSAAPILSILKYFPKEVEGKLLKKKA
jgi:NADH:ubiquinone oxidoreductase subunit F (NADH-binding)/(2Fe-2S) ferredoxin